MVEGGTFSWSNDGPPCLRRISINVRGGWLVAVVGHVGSGKSSLLSAILGEMEKRSGYVSIKVTSSQTDCGLYLLYPGCFRDSPLLGTSDLKFRAALIISIFEFLIVFEGGAD